MQHNACIRPEFLQLQKSDILSNSSGIFEFDTLLFCMINKLLTYYSAEETSKQNQNSQGLLNNKEEQRTI